ncbi:MAG: hypothetical protein QSU88_06600, partial [Candidatus Methanoperedens sp.]|nr:hypothetical protein [Candidatus Methanoperedens sp.]
MEKIYQLSNSGCIFEKVTHEPIPESIKAADRGLVQHPDAEGVQGGNIRRWEGNIYRVISWF